MPQRSKSAPTILDAMRDPALFGSWFHGESWQAWMIVLAAIFGLAITAEHLPLYQHLTGRTLPLAVMAREAWLVVGRRGGKSLIAALIAVFLACLRNYSAILAGGERGVIMVIAADRRQARVVFRYIAAFFDIPLLAKLVESRTTEAIHLANGISIEVHTASFRSTRGYSIVAAICDEIAFWPTDDSAEPDAEILNALRPGMATIPDGLLLCISSPYARRGALWHAWEIHFGRDGDPVLVIQADTRTMNPTINPAIITDAYEADPAAAAAEYGAEFRSDVEALVPRDAVVACTVPGRYELPPTSGRWYRAFVDLPGGSGTDSATLGIAHAEDGTAVVDLLRERRPPFSPEDVVREFAATLRAYQLTTVEGDRYAGEWPRERFRLHGIDYRVAARTKSEIYRETVPLLNSGRLALLDHPRLTAQLLGLERRVGRGGKDSIDHRPGGHDDVTNAACGALLAASGDAAHLGDPRLILGGRPMQVERERWQTVGGGATWNRGRRRAPPAGTPSSADRAAPGAAG